MYLYEHPEEGKEEIYGHYILRDQKTNRIIYDTNILAIGFSIDDEKMWTMHWHGKPDFVIKKIEDAKKKFRDAGLNDYADSIHIIEFSDIDVTEVNKCIEITGYIKKFYEKFSHKKEN